MLSIFTSTAMEYAEHGKNVQEMVAKAGNYLIGTFVAGVGLASLLTVPDNSTVMSSMCSGCFLLGLKNFFHDVPTVQALLKKITIPLLGASLLASQSRDANRTVLDHIRALGAGALLTEGLLELPKRVFLHEREKASIALGMVIAGLLLLSQKDIKLFFGLQKGHSLNPPYGVKRNVQKFANHEKNIKIYRLVLQCADKGRMQSLPFFARIFANYNNSYNYATPRDVSISELELVCEVLPYLRAKNEFSRKSDSSVLVFSTDPNDTVGLQAEFVYNYASLEAYKNYKSTL